MAVDGLIRRRMGHTLPRPELFLLETGTKTSRNLCRGEEKLQLVSDEMTKSKMQTQPKHLPKKKTTTPPTDTTFSQEQLLWQRLHNHNRRCSSNANWSWLTFQGRSRSVSAAWPLVTDWCLRRHKKTSPPSQKCWRITCLIWVTQTSLIFDVCLMEWSGRLQDTGRGVSQNLRPQQAEAATGLYCTTADNFQHTQNSHSHTSIREWRRPQGKHVIATIYIRIKCKLPRLKWYITITIQRSVWEARHTQRLALKQSVQTFAWGVLTSHSIADKVISSLWIQQISFYSS